MLLPVKLAVCAVVMSLMAPTDVVAWGGPMCNRPLCVVVWGTKGNIAPESVAVPSSKPNEQRRLRTGDAEQRHEKPIEGERRLADNDQERMALPPYKPIEERRVAETAQD